MHECNNVCNNTFEGIPVCEIYRMMHGNYVYCSIEEMDRMIHEIHVSDYNELHDWYVYCHMHGIDRYNQEEYHEITSTEEYGMFINRYWDMNDRIPARVEWLRSLIHKYDYPYWTDQGEYEQLVTIPAFTRYDTRFNLDDFCISYRVNEAEFFN